MVEEEELAPRDALEDATPDTDHLAEAMGNGGASYERAYRHAALVVWPRAHEHAMIAEGGPSARRRAGALRARRRPPSEGVRQAFVEAWEPPTRGEGHDAPLTTQALAALRALGDDGLVAAFLSRAGKVGALDEGERDAVADAVAAFPADAAARCAGSLAGEATARRSEAGAALLRRVADARLDDAMRAPITALAEATVGWRDGGRWDRPTAQERVNGVVHLLRAARRAGGSALVLALTSGAMSDRAAFPVDAIPSPSCSAPQGGGSPTRDGLRDPR